MELSEKWCTRFMKDVYEWASMSKDDRTKIGAVLVHWSQKDPISHSYNGFARKVNDNIPERWGRPEKYSWVCHAEENCVLNCARTGRSSNGTVMVTQGIPCSSCADKVIQGGIISIIVHKQWQEYEQKFNWEKWNNSSKITEIKFKEADIPIFIFNKVLGVKGYLDGKIINV